MKYSVFLTISLVILVTFSCQKSTPIPPKVEEKGRLSISLFDSVGNKFDTAVFDNFSDDTTNMTFERLGTYKVDGGLELVWSYIWYDRDSSRTFFQLFTDKRKIKTGMYSSVMSWDTSSADGYSLEFFIGTKYPFGKWYKTQTFNKGSLTVSKVDSTMNSRGVHYIVLSGTWTGTLYDADCNCNLKGQITWSNFRYKQLK
jgi:hypothetical protein